MNAAPKHIDVTPEFLRLDWTDGSSATYPAWYLRGLCQCANCVSEATGELLLDKQKISQDLKITRAEPMGNYAVSLTFSDFHATGIYAFDYLRRYAPSGA
jgi:DUF971 family protein